MLFPFFQGGESRDLLWLFCTCIRIERVRKLFITFLIRNELLSSKVQIPCFRKKLKAIKAFYVTSCSFLHIPKQRLYSMLCGKIKRPMETALRERLATESDVVSALYRLKIH